ncbi:MAG TPA: hypothetical protein GXZ27_08740 [Thermoanaerobacterales bacterium]|jgi:hypothetical protein|nr:hypothetical protein [Thermoanaerobacterales bacterium]
MLDFIRETRAVKEGLHNIILEIPEETYMTFYNELDDEHARDILTQYLKYHQDDARTSDVKIEHNKNAHTVNIYANLHYLCNEKTSQEPFADDNVHLL